jgi:2-oxoacid:acceptor oxidoreductase delta subunit (pyruvate/2-ketoisovalerate family)
MDERRAQGPHIRKALTYKELPIGSTSIGVCEDVVKTGLWRFIRPVLKLKTPPCGEACPAGVDVRGFISLVRQGLFEEAHQLYLEENPFPAICGRVCFHPCEGSCNRKDFDRAVAINGLERFIADFERPLAESPSNGGARVGIVGSGPCGMSCAYYLRRLGHRVVLFEALDAVGGLLRAGIPAYRLPKGIVDREVQKLRLMGIDFRTGLRIDAKSRGSLNGFDAVLLSSGAGKDLPFGVEGKTLSALEFLRTVNLGGRPSLGGRVAVIGGGNTAIDTARAALRLGALPTILYRRSREEMPAFESEIEDALEEGVKILYLVSPVRIVAQGPVQRIECARNRLGEKEPDGRRRPIPIEGSVFQIEVDIVFSATGEAPDLSFLPEEIGTSGGLISIDMLGSTNKRGFFAGGDCVDQPRSVAHAIGSGKRAAIAVDRYLKGKPGREGLDRLEIGGKGALSFKQYRDGNLFGGKKRVIRSDELNLSYFTVSERVEKQKVSMHGQTRFEEIYGSLAPEQALGEAQRCFSCGMCYFCDNCYLLCPDGSVRKQEQGTPNEIDYEYCKGCGICENECPVGAIEMEKEI